MPDIEDDPHAGEVSEHQTKVSNKTVALCYVCYCYRSFPEVLYFLKKTFIHSVTFHLKGIIHLKMKIYPQAI